MREKLPTQEPSEIQIKLQKVITVSNITTVYTIIVTNLMLRPIEVTRKRSRQVICSLQEKLMMLLIFLTWF